VKVLRNPKVTVGLTLVAIGVLYLQFFQRKSLRVSANAEAPAARLAANPQQRNPLPGAQTVQSKRDEIVGTAIDRRYVEVHLSEWIDSPRRDPFLQDRDTFGGENSSPVRSWKLKAIWRQTGGRVATINDRVYQEGDVIQGYKIERIEGDQVWFDGPYGKEHLGFAKPERTRAPQTGTAPASRPSPPITNSAKGARS